MAAKKTTKAPAKKMTARKTKSVKAPATKTAKKRGPGRPRKVESV